MSTLQSVLIYILCYKMGSLHIALQLHTEVPGYFEGYHLYNCVSCELNQQLLFSWDIVFTYHNV